MDDAVTRDDTSDAAAAARRITKEVLADHAQRESGDTQAQENATGPDGDDATQPDPRSRTTAAHEPRPAEVIAQEAPPVSSMPDPPPPSPRPPAGASRGPDVVRDSAADVAPHGPPPPPPAASPAHVGPTLRTDRGVVFEQRPEVQRRSRWRRPLAWLAVIAVAVAAVVVLLPLIAQSVADIADLSP